MGFFSRNKTKPPIDLNSQNFKEVVLHNDQPVVVQFHASWCEPCSVMSSIFRVINEKHQETDVTFAKLDIDAAPKLAEFYGVRSVPTLIVFKEGAAGERFTGIVPKNNLDELIQGLAI